MRERPQPHADLATQRLCCNRQKYHLEPHARHPRRLYTCPYKYQKVQNGMHDTVRRSRRKRRAKRETCCGIPCELVWVCRGEPSGEAGRVARHRILQRRRVSATATTPPVALLLRMSASLRASRTTATRCTRTPTSRRKGASARAWCMAC